MDLIISLLSGALGGNIGGAFIKKINLGLFGNSLAGIIGGGIGSQILLSALGDTVNYSVISNVIGGTAGGMLVMVLIGIIKRSWAQAKT